MLTHPTDAADQAPSNYLNRQPSLYLLAGATAKNNLRRWCRWALAFSFLFEVMAVPQSAQGQTLSVLYTFTSLADGYSPDSLTVDAAGNLYGTTQGGANGSATKRFATSHLTWRLCPFHSLTRKKANRRQACAMAWFRQLMLSF